VLCYPVLMCTGYDNGQPERFAKLAQMGEEIFHTRDLARIWNIKDKNLLYTTLARYTKRGLLFRIQKGLYSLKHPCEVDPVLLGVKALNRYAYLSTESVLVEAGLITQVSSNITLISSQSKKFTLYENTYIVRRLKPEFLFNPAGIQQCGAYYKASVERAVADLLYFNDSYFIDGAATIDWDKVEEIQREIGYKVRRQV